MDFSLGAEFMKLAISAQSDAEYDEDFLPKATKIEKITTALPSVLYGKGASWIGFQGVKSYKLKEVDSGYLSRDIQDQILSLHPDKIEKVECPFLERAYMLKKATKPSAIELTLYHATNPQNIDSILINNFNWRLNGTNRGHKHGKGVSFSPRACFANQFCKSFDKRMIVVKVLYDNAHVGDYHHELPNNGCDTTKSHNGNVFVKFEDSEFVPIYIVHY